MKKLLLAFLLIFTLSISAFAMEQGAYGIYCGTNYWNPDTGEIDDGGTANAALGEGMCRSATGYTALVEKDGDTYYVTIRLLLQSNTNTTVFWKHTGYDTYEEVTYDIMAENAIEDSIDYRFQVDDPFAPIRASMYVIPMGRATVWYIELDESSLNADTGDFEVTVSAEAPVVEETPVVEEPEMVEEEPAIEEEPVVEEPEMVEEPTNVGDGVPDVLQVSEELPVEDEVLEEETETEEIEEEPAVEETPEEPEVEDTMAETESAEETPVAEETITNPTLYIVLAVLAVGCIAYLLVKKGKKK